MMSTYFRLTDSRHFDRAKSFPVRNRTSFTNHRYFEYILSSQQTILSSIDRPGNHSDRFYSRKPKFPCCSRLITQVFVFFSPIFIAVLWKLLVSSRVVFFYSPLQTFVCFVAKTTIGELSHLRSQTITSSFDWLVKDHNSRKRTWISRRNSQVGTNWDNW